MTTYKGALERYNESVQQGEEPDALARLKFYCSLAMTNGNDWINAEKFFEDVEEAMQQPAAVAGQEPVDRIEMMRAHASVVVTGICAHAKNGHTMTGWLDDACTSAEILQKELKAAPVPAAGVQGDGIQVDDSPMRRAFEQRSVEHHNNGCLKRGLSQKAGVANGYIHFDMNVEWAVWKDACAWQAAATAQPDSGRDAALESDMDVIRQQWWDFKEGRDYGTSDPIVIMLCEIAAWEAWKGATAAAHPAPPADAAVVWHCVNTVTGKMLYTDSESEMINMRDANAKHWQITPFVAHPANGAQAWPNVFAMSQPERIAYAEQLRAHLGFVNDSIHPLDIGIPADAILAAVKKGGK